MFTFPFWLALLLAIGDWLAVWRGWRRARWVTKTGALLLLLVWFTLLGGWRGSLAWFGTGLIFSLLGDVLLLLPAHFFPGGLAAFLCAHLAYIVGFNSLPIAWSWDAVLAAVVLLAGAAVAGRQIRRSIRRYARNSRLLPAVTLYMVVISLMVISAGMTFYRPGWSFIPALLCGLGGLLFWISDALLGLTRFVRSYRYAPVTVMITYHLAQIAITAGALMAFGAAIP